MSTGAMAIVCVHVFKSERPVAIVVHHLDGMWQLICGEYDHPEDCSDFEVVCLEHLTDRQANLAEVIGIESGRLAEQNGCGSWLCQPFEECDEGAECEDRGTTHFPGWVSLPRLT